MVVVEPPGVVVVVVVEVVVGSPVVVVVVVVDWHGSVTRELRETGLPVSPEDFARAWRAGYAPAMDEVRRAMEN